MRTEQIAAIKMLDDRNKPLEREHADYNAYTLRSTSGCNVVIAGLYQPGNSSAAIRGDLGDIVMSKLVREQAKVSKFKHTGTLPLPLVVLLHVTQDFALKDFHFPSHANNILDPSDYTHARAGASCKEGGYNTAKYIKLHRGVIASGELFGILFFRIEAAGVLADLPCLFIREILDYCDSHKND
ncbi:hypothetical protein BJY00DRAFT_305400 [Aspergillus carlsbadensis]|nr:hypothetical protein BJY00DRAFT_305400 [Aspergillus carlsbadensis]